LPPPGAASVVAAVAAWSFTWIGLMIQEATFGIGDLVGMGFWSKPRPSGWWLSGTSWWRLPRGQATQAAATR
jgi:hypothetical protein